MEPMRYFVCVLAEIVFAEDIFGNQFCYFENKIYQFDAETGDKKYLAKNIEDWSNKILSEFNFLTGYSLAHDWQLKNGTIPYKMRLIPTKLFILGGEYSIDNLRLVDSLEGLKIRGPIAQSILNLENKTKVKINLVD